jgi:hypothetical protein
LTVKLPEIQPNSKLQKAWAAALLMANLQANLRSQCATATEQPSEFLHSVNQLFFENTADGDYATLFFSEYDHLSRRLRYAKLRSPSRSPSPGEMARLSGSTPPPRSSGSSTNGTALSKNVSYVRATQLSSIPTAQPNPSTILERSSGSGG